MNEFDPYNKWLGIKHSNRPVDHYELLGLKRFESDSDVIESSVARLVVHLQNMAGGKHAEASQQLLNEIARARICLTDPDKRAEYDRQLENDQAKATHASADRPARKHEQSSSIYVLGYVGLVLVAAGLALAAVIVVTNRSNPNIAKADDTEYSDPVNTSIEDPIERDRPFVESDSEAKPAGGFTPLSLDGLDGEVAPIEPPVEEKTAVAENVRLDSVPDIARVNNPDPVVPGNGVLFETSFEKIKPGPFQSQQLDEIELNATGTASINTQFAHSGKQCLRLYGDAGNSLTFSLPDNLHAIKGIGFQAERWTAGNPFEFSIEVQQKGSWKHLAKLDKFIKVGKRFLSEIKLAIPGGPTTAIRFNVKAAPKAGGTGVLIDDLVFYSDAPESTTPIPVRRTFEGFATHFDLPELTDTAEKKIDDLTISRRFLMGASLFVSEGATRNKISFEMRRSKNDKQRWVVSKRGRVDDQTVDVANFWRTDAEYWFQWLPAAKEDENVYYLRNGALKLETPDGQLTWLNLRKPILIKDFLIPTDETSVKVKTELPWMPTPKSVVIEVMSFSDLPSHCVPEYVTKDPGRMYFTRDESKAFVWLEVTAARRDEYVLEADLKISMQGKIAPATPGLLSKYQQRFAKIATDAKAAHDATQNKAKRKQIAPTLQAAAKTSAIFKEYGQIIPKIYGKHIPVAIYLNVEGHRVLIAKTPGVSFKP